MTFNDEQLYERMVATLLASWERYAEGTAEASVDRIPGAAIARFPAGPERFVYNNAVIERRLDDSTAADAVRATVEAYREVGIGAYAVWAHESEQAAIAELVRRGFRVDTWTRAMAMSPDEIAAPAPPIEVGPSEWREHLRYLKAVGAPEGLLGGLSGDEFHVLVARLDGETAATAIAYDHEGDCGIYNMGTFEHARRRGLGTALVALHLRRARERGCETASLQSTEIAQGVYAAAGFRDLGRFIEYVPPVAAT